MDHKRKRLWIDVFQTKLVFRVALYGLFYQIASCSIFALYSLFRASLAADAQTPVLPNVAVQGLLAFLLLTPPLACDAVRFAHRLVGPLYRFRKTIQALAAGEPVSLIQLRKDDFLGDFKDDFNALLRRLAETGAITLEGAPNGQAAEANGCVAS